MRTDAEYVASRLLLEYARRTAIVKDGQGFEFLGDRGDCETAPGRNISDHRIHLITLYEVSVFGNDVGNRTGLIDILGLDLGSAESDLIEWRRSLAGIERLDDDLGTVATWNSEWRRRRTRQKRHDPQLDWPG